MRLSELGLRDFRCFKDANLDLAAENIIVGANGAGKTSLLEAIYFLSRGRSFRSNRAESLVRHGGERLQVFGNVNTNGATTRLGIERVQGQVRARYGGEPAHNIAPLTRALPALVIEPHTHVLVEGGPGQRRRFIDWGTFHVEPDFLRVWRRYRRALAQRNSLLREGARRRMLAAWDGEFVAAAEAIDAGRKAWLRGYQDALGTMTPQLAPGHDIAVAYRSGWPEGLSLREALVRTSDRDRERGMTTVGPHRGELQVRWDGRLARDQVSRGQQKILATTLLIAQATEFNRNRSESCLMLVDDPAAELDAERLERLLGVLHRLDVQLFLTATRIQALGQPSSVEGALFHVERGRVRAVN